MNKNITELKRIWFDIGSKDKLIGNSEHFQICKFIECRTMIDLLKTFMMNDIKIGQCFFYKNICFIYHGDYWLLIRDNLLFGKEICNNILNEFGIRYFILWIQDILMADTNHLLNNNYQKLNRLK